MSSYCAPSTEDVYHRTGSCLSLDTMKKVARKVVTAPRARATIAGATKAQLGSMLKYLTGRPQHEWSKLEGLDAELRQRLEAGFRPQAPSTWIRNRREWLDSENIESVMRQYEKRYRSFKFMGVSARDYDAVVNSYGSCVSQPLCALDLAGLQRRGVSRFGVVFNLDRHDQSGSHWVALYCSFVPSRRNFGVYFYDSLGRPPPREIKRLMDVVVTQVAAMHPRASARFQVGYNDFRRQYKNTECGVFSILLLVRLLANDKTFKEICQTTGRDDEIHAYRQIFYRPPTSNAAR